MKTKNELMARRAIVMDDLEKFIADHQNAEGLLSEEDKKTADAMKAKVQDYTKQIQDMEEMEKLRDSLKEPTSKPIVTDPAKPADVKTGRASDEYKKGFKDFVKRGVVTNALEEGTDSEGGYLVPDEFERTLVKALEEQNAIRTIAKVITTESGTRKIPVVSQHGSASWIDEEGEYQESDEVFGQVTLGAHKVGTLIKISDELLNDSAFDMEAYIADEFGRRIGAKEEEAFAVGNGTGKPTGIFDATAGGTVAITTAGNAPTADELIDLVFALKAPYRKNAVWLMNDSTVKVIRKLKDGNGQYLWQQGLGENNVNGTLLGRPIVTTPYAPAVAAGNAIIAFGDFNYYWIADREGITFKRLNELFAVTGQVGFRASRRVDGKLILREAVQILKIKTA